MQINDMPIWLVFVATVIVVMFGVEVGYRLGQTMHRRSDEEKESPVSAIAGAILGLAAFMLAFTFGIVSQRYDAKKALVRDDANAIRTAWQRSDFLPDKDRDETKQLLRRYVAVRVDLAQGRTVDPQKIKSGVTETRQIQDRLWEIAVVHGRTDLNSDIGAMYAESLNQVADINALRIAVGIQARVPFEIWLVLYFVTILGMVGVGYQTGIAGSKRSLARPFLALSFALVFALIASLDRPESGVLKVTQQPLIDLREYMDLAGKS